jgi:hypothetical protein
MLLSIFLIIIAPVFVYLLSLFLGSEVSYINGWIINIVYVIFTTIIVVPTVIKCAVIKS